MILCTLEENGRNDKHSGRVGVKPGPSRVVPAPGIYPEFMFPECTIPDNVNFPNVVLPTFLITSIPLPKGVSWIVRD